MVEKLLGVRLLTAIKSTQSTYWGVCVMQAPGGWTRVGPTWHIRDHGWVTVGPGAGQWGTKSGLAELASAATATPKMHASGAVLSPQPNLVIPCTPEAVAHLKLSELESEAEAICKKA